VRFGISSIRFEVVAVEPVFCGTVVLEDADVDVDESPKTRDKDGNVNVLECPFPLLLGPSSLIVSSLFFSFSLSLSGFLRNGRASDGNLRKVDVDVDVDVEVVDMEEGVGTGDEVETGVRFLPKGGVVISY
jgi:hypothetical protein